jgi:hypothetical protein
VATKVLADAGQSLPPEVVTALVSKILSSGIAELENYVNSKI